MARSGLPERADAKEHVIAVPALLIDFQHGNAGRRARQSRSEAAQRLLAAEPVRDRDNQGCGHTEILYRKSLGDLT